MHAMNLHRQDKLLVGLVQCVTELGISERFSIILEVSIGIFTYSIAKHTQTSPS